MVNDTNISGEESFHRHTMQRIFSMVKRRKVVNSGGDVVVQSGTLSELDLLDCPVCCNALSAPIFQCGNGHIVCSSCCTKMRQKCPYCTLPIGNYRCRVIENVLEAITIPCRFTKNGCKQKFSYGKEVAHENECTFGWGYCPAPNCIYRCLHEDLYNHYKAKHKNTMKRFFLSR
ncbi:E3 ubiquitin-protein ligase SINA-like 2 [Cardamine amara subsp. amara]|uniref:RING-type E3 ubiquitin transferase n=1 Tax=Cardamine amara subsp. amara TaxID=228776 RepID=A0ABD0ZXZ3_CARAN